MSLLHRNLINCRYADIGAGDQYFAHLLLGLTNQPVHVVDIHYASRQHGTQIVQHRDVEEIAPRSVEGVFLLDVLEHVENDNALMDASLKTLREGGTVLITVPAHPFLFSEHDVFLKHYRRYTREGVLRLTQKHALFTEEHFSFYTSLFVVRSIQVIIQKFLPSPAKSSGAGHWPFSQTHWITRSVAAMLDWDFKLNRCLAMFGIRLPGLSLCLLCQKKSA